MIDHRGDEFAEMQAEITSGLATLIGTSGDVVLLTGSGSGAMEAAIVNTLSPGDRVLAVIIGGFGDRFADIAQAFGARGRRSLRGGEADPAALAARLADAPPYRAVLLTTQRDLDRGRQPAARAGGRRPCRAGRPTGHRGRHQRAGRHAVRDGRLGRRPGGQRQPEGVDGVAGIAIAASGPRAQEAEASAGMPRAYWSFAEARKWAAKGQTRGRRRWPSSTDCGSACGGCWKRVASVPGPAIRRLPPARRRASGLGAAPGRQAAGSVRHRHRRLAAGRLGMGAVQRRHAEPRAGGRRRPGQVVGENHALRAHGHGRDRRDGRRGAGHGRDHGRPRLRDRCHRRLPGHRDAYEASRSAAAR